MEKVCCEACKVTFDMEEHYAYSSGYFCSRKCYNTLFLICEECKKLDMSAKLNLDKNGEQLCDICYMKKHNLSVAVLSFGSICRCSCCGR